jgi:hypothetical protein
MVTWANEHCECAGTDMCIGVDVVIVMRQAKAQSRELLPPGVIGEKCVMDHRDVLQLCSNSKHTKNIRTLCFFRCNVGSRNYYKQWRQPRKPFSPPPSLFADLDFAVSWVANVKRSGITGYIVGAMDDDMLKCVHTYIAYIFRVHFFTYMQLT